MGQQVVLRAGQGSKIIMTSSEIRDPCSAPLIMSHRPQWQERRKGHILALPSQLACPFLYRPAYSLCIYTIFYSIALAAVHYRIKLAFKASEVSMSTSVACAAFDCLTRRHLHSWLAHAF
jgi:hypothetical protein